MLTRARDTDQLLSAVADQMVHDMLTTRRAA